MGRVPAFPEENVIARVEGGPEAGGPPQAPAPPAPERSPSRCRRRPLRAGRACPASCRSRPARPGRRLPRRSRRGRRRYPPAMGSRLATVRPPAPAMARATALARTPPTGPSSARQAPPPSGGCASRNRASAGAAGAAASTGGTASGRARLVHDGCRALALHRLRPRPLPRRDRRRLHWCHRGRDGHRRDRPDRARRQHRRDRVWPPPSTRSRGPCSASRAVYLSGMRAGVEPEHL